jgi:predicted permease
LTTLGVEPLAGRLFTPDEDRPGGPGVALIAHGLWIRRFGGDRATIGRSLELEGRSYTVVGVMPPGFDMPYSAELWVPMQIGIASLPLDQQAATANEFVARLAPGVGREQAEAELKGLARRLEEDYPRIRRGWSFGLVPLRRQLLADLSGRTHRSLAALVVAVGFLLLICCANVASLLLARGVSREGEIAIRRSLGAGAGRLVRQLLTESLLLAPLGGVLGLLLALWAQPLLRAFSPIQAAGLGAYLTDFRVDGRVLLFSSALSILTTAAFGLLPAARAARSADLVASLKSREQRSGGGAGKRSLGALVIAEIAVATTLLVGGALMAQSFRHLQETPWGFRPHQLLTLELPLSPAKYAAQARRTQLMEEVLGRVRALPRVVAAGMTTNVPLQRGVTLESVFEAEGRPPTNPADVPITSHRLVSPGYPDVLGVTLARGRLLDEHDRAGSLPVAVVSEELVRQAWPEQDPIGKRVRRLRSGEPGPWMTVVGVVKDVKEDRYSFRTERPVWYLPYAQQTLAIPVSLPLNLVVRSAGEPEAVATAVREAIRAVDPDQPVANMMPMNEALADLLVGERFGAVSMGTLAGLGLVLAAVGLYGVMAYSVGQRTGEIGLRMALGARPRDVLGLVLREGARMIGWGLLAGLAGASVLSHLLATTLYGVSASDPRTLLGVLVALAATGFAACWIPARRATRVDPMVAVRHE